ncbi:hypothetical protein Tco_0328916 [Tanacetum coccineum]
MMEAHLAPNPPIQVNQIASSCEICSGLYDTQYCMENPDLEGLVSNFMAYQDARLSKFEANFKQQQIKMVIQGGRIHKSNKKSLNAKGKGKRKGKGKDKNLLLKSTWQRMTLATTANRWGIGRGIVLLTLLS